MNFKNPHNTKAFRENPLICNVQITFMRSRFSILFCVLFFILGCSKDKFLDKPTIRVKSFTPVVPIGGDFNAVLEYSQKKGVINGDSLTIIRHRYNLKPVPTDIQTTDTFTTILTSDPAIPNSNTADFSVTLAYNDIQIDNGENDTIDFRFLLTDLSGRRSDTVRTGQIVLLH